MTPDEITWKLSEFVNKYERLKIIGGCCVTSIEHIKHLRSMLDSKQESTLGDSFNRGSVSDI